jgi:glutamate-1-semialdehyde 2,1-aminomutase
MDFESASTSDTAAFARFHRSMLDQGIWLPPSQYEAVFLSTAHTMDDIDATITAAKEAFAAVAESPS